MAVVHNSNEAETLSSFRPAEIKLARVLYLPSPARLLTLIGFGVGLAIIFAPGLTNLPGSGAMTAGTITIFLALWATGSLSEYAASILFLLVANVLALAPPSVIFSGFTSEAGWFVFGGLLFGSAVKQSGLGAGIADRILKRAGSSYLIILFGISGAALALTFLLPSAVGRVVIIVPIVALLAERLGLPSGTNGHTGMTLTAVLATTQPCYTVLTASFPNIAIIGIGSRLYDIEFSYAGYLLANFPVVGLLSILAIPVVLRILFPDQICRESHDRASTALGSEGRYTLVIMLCALALWLTDRAHGLSPAWVALGAGLCCILPGLGSLRHVPFSNCVRFEVWFLCSVLMGLGAIVDHVGLGAAMATQLVPLLGIAPGNDFANFFLIGAMNLLVTALTTTAGAPAILSPVAGDLAVATGWPVLTVLYLQIPALLFFPLPYAMPAVIAGVAMAGVSIKQTAKALSALAVVGLVTILPLHFLWLRVIGHLP